MDRICFKINGHTHSVGCEVSSSLTLLEYIRNYAELRGTKYMCLEGGCGACIVSVIKEPGGLPQAVNSCLVSITSCQDWEITTIEKVGNKLDGYHPLQTTLAEKNATQCGYCSPGWIMAMYSLTQNKTQLTKLEIEKSFGSNVCRCTGYRPILDTFKKFADHINNLPDIEDLKICKRRSIQCKKVCVEDEWCLVSKEDVVKLVPIAINLKDGRKWFKVKFIVEIFLILHQEGDDSYMLVAGNTAKGVAPILEYPRILIDISSVAELKGHYVDQNLVIESGVTLSDLLNILKAMSQVEYFEYLQKFYEHIKLVAHIPVRNVMPRAQSAPAVVNAGFLYKINKGKNTVVEARIVFGGLSAKFVRALKTEQFLTGKNLFTNNTLQEAIVLLYKELIVTENPTNLSAKYRKQLAIKLFYKGLLELCPPSKVSSSNKSGAIRIKETRPASDARQIFYTDPSLWPLNQPVQKLEALIQSSGEAPYTEDLPMFPHEVYAAFVLSTVAIGKIEFMNTVKALSYPGVITIYTAKDIPGVNSFTAKGEKFYPINEEVLADTMVQYYNQPIAIVVAESRAIADRAAKLVEVKYSGGKTPVTDIKAAIKDPKRNTDNAASAAKDKGTDVVKVIKGDNAIYGQYHFTMETLVCVTKPTEEGLEVYSSTQWMDGVQMTVAAALNMDINKVDVYVRRLGGAYGVKISRSAQQAVACSLVAKKLNRPCRFIQSLTTNMRAVGKRLPCYREFEAGVNAKGEIQYIDYNLYEDNGFVVNEPLAQFGADAYYNCYNNIRWNYKSINTVTDTAKNTWCRAPGTLENIAMAEILMERIAYEMSLDPLEVRLANLDDMKFGEFREMIDNFKNTASYNTRRAAVNKFNNENRWKKRGLRFSLCKWTPLSTQYFDINLSVYHRDGTVVITHSGIEMGQGVNTKAAQVAAYFLKIPLDKIEIKGNNTVIAPNGSISGGSLTSQNVGAGVQRACEQLLARLEPIRNQMTNPTWEELVQQAFVRNVDLQSHGFINSADVQNYNIFGVALAEVEIDVLTGQHEAIRVDLLQDVGRSVNPEIDVGQVEGAFIMGLGYWTSEQLVYDKKTGELLTDRTWNYYVPQARDIPQDFRVYLRKNSYSEDRFQGAKASGEPPICLSVVITLALREAIAAARRDSGVATSQWFDIDGPFTVEKICLATATKPQDFKFS